MGGVLPRPPFPETYQCATACMDLDRARKVTKTPPKCPATAAARIKWSGRTALSRQPVLIIDESQFRGRRVTPLPEDEVQIVVRGAGRAKVFRLIHWRNL